MYWPYSASRPCLMSTPPIHQKKALVAARSASSWSWPKSEPAQLAQLTWTFNASMMANPPPANGSTRSCAGKASTPTMMRRRLSNWTLPGVTAPLGSTMVTWRGEMKSDCSRSEEHTSEPQSHSDLVCRLLLEKKNKQTDHLDGRPDTGQTTGFGREADRQHG